MSRKVLFALIVCLSCGFVLAPAQEQAKRTYTRAEFIKITGGSLNDRVERAFKQFKSSNQGDSVWIAYHFAARDNASIGPFSGMIYYDDGIRLERKEDPAAAAVFLLTEAQGSQPKFAKVKTLSLSDQYVFEDRQVYWLGDVDAGQSLSLLEGLLKETGEKESRELSRGALRAIALHNSPRVVPFLKEIAAKDSNLDLQRAAVSNLARVKNSESLDALIDLYDGSTVESMKDEIISGIARDASRKATDKLLAIAKNDPDPKRRQQAVKRLSSSRGTGFWVN